MDSIERYLYRLCEMDRLGGRVVRRDEHTCVLYDVGVWGDDFVGAFRMAHPECDVKVVAHNGSLSGFVVVITRQSQLSHFWTGSMIIAIVLSVYFLEWFPT